MRETLPGRLEELYILLYEFGVLELDDVTLVQAWITDLLRVGYKFPQLVSHGYTVAGAGKRPSEPSEGRATEPVDAAMFHAMLSP